MPTTESWLVSLANSTHHVLPSLFLIRQGFGHVFASVCRHCDEVNLCLSLPPSCCPAAGPSRHGDPTRPDAPAGGLVGVHCLPKKQQYCRGAVGTSTRAVACAFASQPFLCAHPPVLSHGHKNLTIDCGDVLLSNDLLLSSSALLF